MRTRNVLIFALAATTALAAFAAAHPTREDAGFWADHGWFARSHGHHNETNDGDDHGAHHANCGVRAHGNATLARDSGKFGACDAAPGAAHRHHGNESRENETRDHDDDRENETAENETAPASHDASDEGRSSTSPNSDHASGHARGRP